jgi:hypothetical protein
MSLVSSPGVTGDGMNANQAIYRTEHHGKTADKGAANVGRKKNCRVVSREDKDVCAEEPNDPAN